MDPIITKYRQAYEDANNSPAPELSYNKGWFTLTHAGGLTSKYRKADIMRMTDTLIRRTNGDLS